jgi:hypothetical protein
VEKKLLTWLLVALASYPVGCGIFMVSCQISESVSDKEPQKVLRNVQVGMTPAVVEAMMGRASEYTVRYGRADNNE